MSDAIKTSEQSAQFEARVKELIAAGLDHRVARDQAGAEMIPERERCKRCDGTGNELMFMFRRCTECNGTGRRKAHTFAPPSIALALMAWRLAQDRIHPFVSPELAAPIPREQVDDMTPCSTEYYHILRRLADGETP